MRTSGASSTDRTLDTLDALDTLIALGRQLAPDGRGGVRRLRGGRGLQGDPGRTIVGNSIVHDVPGARDPRASEGHAAHTLRALNALRALQSLDALRTLRASCASWALRTHGTNVALNSLRPSQTLNALRTDGANFTLNPLGTLGTYRASRTHGTNRTLDALVAFFALAEWHATRPDASGTAKTQVQEAVVGGQESKAVRLQVILGAVGIDANSVHVE